jgi:hypothetical protein
MGKKTREAEAAHREARAKLILDYQERLEVHARLTAKAMGLSPKEAIPALTLLCFIMAEKNNCQDEVEKAVSEFMIKAGVVSQAEYDSW